MAARATSHTLHHHHPVHAPPQSVRPNTLTQQATLRLLQDTETNTPETPTLAKLEFAVAHRHPRRLPVGQLLKSISIAPPRDLYTKFLHISEPVRRWP